jgi:seryl-tRNA synthetase
METETDPEEARRSAQAHVESVLGPAPTLESDAWLEALVGVQASLMESLGLRGRVLDMPTRELGASAHRKFDLEAWMPGRQVGEEDAAPGAWGEVTSASNCTDYQARRLGLRYRDPATKKLAFAHTLNGTAVAVPRVIVAMLETWQQDDGAVVVPQPLRPFLGGKQLLEPIDSARQGIRAAGPRSLRN